MLGKFSTAKAIMGEFDTLPGCSPGKQHRRLIRRCLLGLHLAGSLITTSFSSAIPIRVHAKTQRKPMKCLEPLLCVFAAFASLRELLL